MSTIGATTEVRPQEGIFERQLEHIGWALFLIMIGGLALLPAGWVPEGTWLVGVGLIMVGMNITRHRKGIRISGFTTLLGVAAMAAGFFSMAGIDFPVFPIVLVAIGLQILYSVLLSKRGTP